MPYTTFASIIKNLEKKGFVSAILSGNTYIYSPAISEEEYKKKFMSGFVKEYFKNSYTELVNFFVQNKKLTPKQLKDLANLIEKGNKNP